MAQSPHEATRLLLVDDHKVVRSGLRMLLENEADLTIVGEAGTGQEALQLVEQLQPDLVLMDIGLPDQSGIEVTTISQTALAECRHRRADDS